MDLSRARIWKIKGYQFGGPDAADFLKRISTINISRLVVGGLARGLFLGGSSELVAAFYCRRDGQNSFQIICPISEAEAFSAHVEKMTFAEDLSLIDLPIVGFEIMASSLMDVEKATQELPFSGQRTSLRGAARESAQGLIFWEESEGLIRGYFLGETPNLQGDGSRLESRAGSDWDWALVDGFASTRGVEWEPGQRALDAGLLFWIDRDKGCYPGQEVVEKSLNLGHPAQVLALLEGEGELSLGTKVLRDGREVGVVTRSASMGGVKTHALAKIRWGSHEPGTKLDLVDSLGENHKYNVLKALLEPGD